MRERKRQFKATNRKTAQTWQVSSRALLFKLLKLDDLVELERKKPGIPFKPKVLTTKKHTQHTVHELEINSTPTRRITVIVTVPNGRGKYPSVVCIHGHGGNRGIVYSTNSIYRGFGLSLARTGFVTISTDVGQHQVVEKGRTLMGERLWDVWRCVTYLTTRPEVGADRIGCAGLSLGGEMAMWLAAMDPRVRAAVSSGFLTSVANIRKGHCPCWDFPGLTEHFDFADLYSLTAPRALMCQNGEKERAPGGFPVSIAKKAMAEIKACYRVFGAEDRAVLAVHPEGHVFDVRSAIPFLDKHLKQSK